MSDPIYLLIVDDEQFFRDTLENYFSTCEDITVVATADNGAHALQVLEKTMADVVLCDVRMPLLDGVEFTRTVAERNLPCNILALTSFNDDQAMLSMLQSGAPSERRLSEGPPSPRKSPPDCVNTSLNPQSLQKVCLSVNEKSSPCFTGGKATLASLKN